MSAWWQASLWALDVRLHLFYLLNDLDCSLLALDGMASLWELNCKASLKCYLVYKTYNLSIILPLTNIIYSLNDLVWSLWELGGMASLWVLDGMASLWAIEGMSSWMLLLNNISFPHSPNQSVFYANLPLSRQFWPPPHMLCLYWWGGLVLLPLPPSAHPLPLLFPSRLTPTMWQPLPTLHPTPLLWFCSFKFYILPLPMFLSQCTL